MVKGLMEEDARVIPRQVRGTHHDPNIEVTKCLGHQQQGMRCV